MLFSKVLSVVHPFYEVDGIYILPVDGVGFETYFSILDELEIFNVVKTDNDLRAVTGKGTYSVLGFSRCNNYIGGKSVCLLNKFKRILFLPRGVYIIQI